MKSTTQQFLWERCLFVVDPSTFPFEYLAAIFAGVVDLVVVFLVLFVGAGFAGPVGGALVNAAVALVPLWSHLK